MGEYEKLMDILARLPTEVQKVIKDLASERARQYCDKYDNHLPDFKDAAYNYELSKRTRDFISTAGMPASRIECYRAICEIKDYFTEKFEWVLNGYIQTRYIDVEGLKGPLHEVLP